MKVEIIYGKKIQIIAMLEALACPYHCGGDLSPLAFLSENLLYIYTLLEERYQYSYDIHYKILNGDYDEIINKIKLYGFEKYEKYLEEAKKEYEKILTKELIDKYIDITKEVFILNKIPEKITIGLYYDFYTVSGFASNYLILKSVNKYRKISKCDIKILLHEILHYLFDNFNSSIYEKYKEKYGNPPSSQFEETLIDLTLPHILYKIDFFSEEEKIKEFQRIENKILTIPKRYEKYSKELLFLKDYDFSTNVWEYILERTKDNKIKEICNCILEKLQSKK